MVMILLRLVLWMVIITVLLLLPAGTLDWPAAWILITVFGIGGLAMILWLARYSPRLLAERMGSIVQRDQKPWDRVWLVMFVVVFFAWFVFMGWDAARSQFTAVPLELQLLGFLGLLANGFGTWWTFRENTFAAPVVKIQEGQQVIDTGPYAFVRHPMYTSALFLFFSIPLLLGSWAGLLFSVFFTLALAWRTLGEERTLRAELQGYERYTQRVRYRFIPRIW